MTEQSAAPLKHGSPNPAGLEIRPALGCERWASRGFGDCEETSKVWGQGTFQGLFRSVRIHYVQIERFMGLERVCLFSLTALLLSSPSWPVPVPHTCINEVDATKP